MERTAYAGTVGYVGLGNMGAGISSHLVQVGLDVVVYDLRADAVESLVREGARGAASLPELVHDVDTVIVCVDPERQAVNVVRQLAEHLRSDQTVIVQSSVPPDLLFEAARIVEPSGALLFDAPVSGSIEDRLNGTLAVLVGASAASVASQRPLLEAIGRPLYFDVLGGGEVAKLANNAIMSATRVAVTEVMEFAAAYGLSEDNVRRAAAISSGSCWVLDHWEYFDSQLASGFSLRMGTKQSSEILKAAERKGVRLRMIEAVRDSVIDVLEARYTKLTGRDPKLAMEA